MAVIEIENVHFSYPGGVEAIRGVSMSVEAGEFVCVIGRNGSGKSTLARHMNALLVPDEGAVRVLGTDTSSPAAQMQARCAVGMVFQNPDDQIVADLVEDDVAFGPENLAVDPAEIRERVTDALSQVGLAGFERRQSDALSGGEKQRVAIAGALAMRPQALVLDEADSMLDPAGRAMLMELCRELCNSGLAVVFITHYLETAAHADRVIAMNDGAIALDGAPAAVLAETARLEELGLICGRASCDKGSDPLSHFSLGKCDKGSDPLSHDAVGEAVLYVRNVGFSYEDGRRALHDVSFSLHAGEVLGVAGSMGSGKSTLAQVVGGLREPSEGTVLLSSRDGESEAARSSGGKVKEVGVVFQYPERQLFAPSVYEDVAFGPRNLGLAKDEVDVRVREALESLRLDFEELCDRSPFALSGGQQRLVAIAGVLAMQPRVLVLDEPTAGLDPQGRGNLVALVAALCESGQAAIVISHDADVLEALCSNVLMLAEGRVVAQGRAEDVLPRR